jgi:hypothetical protein
MNTTEHKKYLNEFKAYSREILSTRESAQQFLVRSGINSESGKLTKNYSLPSSYHKKQ